MDFRKEVFTQLRGMGERAVLREGEVETSGRELLALVGQARAFFANAGITAGDRVVLIGENSVRWVALDIAMMFDGIVVVPMYARQVPAELAAMIRDADPALVLCDGDDILSDVDAALRGSETPSGVRTGLAREAFAVGECAEPAAVDAGALLRIIYTSGTSGPAKGVMLSRANFDFMLPQTINRIGEVMKGAHEAERSFQYLPCCFCASWLLLWTCLSRGAVLTLCMDLKKIGEELRDSNPHYVLNVPLLLERMRDVIENLIRERGGFARWLWNRAWLARWTVYPVVHRQIAPALRALFCGSAPLSADTQRFFERIGIPVLQAYGLTETTGVCTMDAPGIVEAGYVGRAIDGCEMRLDEHGEIHVRGPHVFAGYWGQPPREGEWFATGDLGAQGPGGHWKIIGRAKFMIVLAGGHNVPPEEIEQELRLAIPNAEHVVLVGHGRKFLSAIVAGKAIDPAAAEAAREAVNEGLNHYKQIRKLHLCDKPFTPESGLLTANGKLKRTVIEAHFRNDIDRMYA